MTYYRQDELYHYGVLGMKWGVHKARMHAKSASNYREKADKNITLSIIAKQRRDNESSEYFNSKAKKANAKGDKHAKKANYEYKSWGTKHNEKLAKKYADKFHEISNRPTHTEKYGKTKSEVFDDPKDGRRQMRALTKAKKYNRRFERSKELDKREQAYATRVKTGGNIAVRLLTGGAVGSKPYQQYVSMMGAQGKGNNLMKLGAAGATSLLGGRLGSTAVKAIYLRSGERDAVDYLKENVGIYGDSKKKK